MKFAIATITYFESKGFDTENWRKSVDGLKALCHDKFAEALIQFPDENVLVLDVDSQEFKDLIENEFIEELEKENY